MEQMKINFMLRKYSLSPHSGNEQQYDINDKKRNKYPKRAADSLDEH
jgi:hypothetical protein